jgi:hypothetical protein
MNRVHYFKRHQAGQDWHYYKLLSQRDPPARELINFLNPTPIIEFMEYDLSLPAHQIQYEAFWEVGIVISASEYEAAYKRATSGNFDLYLNGKPVGS